MNSLYPKSRRLSPPTHTVTRDGQVIELAPAPKPVVTPGRGTPYRPLPGRTVIRQDYGRETYSHQFYMTPSRENLALSEKLRQSMPSEATHEELVEYVKQSVLAALKRHLQNS